MEKQNRELSSRQELRNRKDRKLIEEANKKILQNKSNLGKIQLERHID